MGARPQFPGKRPLSVFASDTAGFKSGSALGHLHDLGQILLLCSSGYPSYRQGSCEDEMY